MKDTLTYKYLVGRLGQPVHENWHLGKYAAYWCPVEDDKVIWQMLANTSRVNYYLFMHDNFLTHNLTPHHTLNTKHYKVYHVSNPCFDKLAVQYLKSIANLTLMRGIKDIDRWA